MYFADSGCDKFNEAWKEYKKTISALNKLNRAIAEYNKAKKHKTALGYVALDRIRHPRLEKEKNWEELVKIPAFVQAIAAH